MASDTEPEIKELQPVDVASSWQTTTKGKVAKKVQCGSVFKEIRIRVSHM